jgi:putative membrane protein
MGFWGRIIVKWLIIAASLVVVAFILPGVHVDGNGTLAVLVMAAVLGVANAVIRPILAFLSCGCIMATLGLFIFVVNAVVFYLAAEISRSIGVGFYVDSFWAALLASIIVSIVSTVLNIFIVEPVKPR